MNSIGKKKEKEVNLEIFIEGWGREKSKAKRYLMI